MLLTSATHIRALMLACVPPRDHDQKSPGEDDSALVSLVIPKMGKVIPDLEDMEDMEYIYIICECINDPSHCPCFTQSS